MFPSSTVSPSLTTLRLVVVKVDMQPSLHIYPIGMRAPDFRWGRTWDVRDAWFKRGFSLIICIWLACVMLL